ncbi:hypothetical protein [Maridesulfovibrio bastinii]|uniref:hypothetical protein n=1 Tax=Maridesulfovibrio bastinii TaxID=47157 RepID=UPI000401CE0D|nr:hypothetical protein [Maridesulfovibrio bastinii]
MTTLLLILLSLTELVLLTVVILFFIRLKKSESLLMELQSKQQEFINKLHFNAQLENELVNTFEKRQAELSILDKQLEEKSAKLEKIIKQAQEFSKSPQFLRQIILTGHRAGKSASQLAKGTGLTLDEVELIIDQGG